MIERTAVVEEGVLLSEGCYIGHFTQIRKGTVIGKYSHVRAHCFIALDVTIGENSRIYQFSNICKNTIIGDNVYIGIGVMFTNTERIAHGRKYEPEILTTTIEDGVRIAAGVILLPGITIHKNAMIGACSLVTRNVGENDKMMGIPARRIGEVPIEERA